VIDVIRAASGNMKDNTDPRRTHSAVCVTVQTTAVTQASSAAEKGARQSIFRVRTGRGWVVFIAIFSSLDMSVSFDYCSLVHSEPMQFARHTSENEGRRYVMI
jgi:hypothetical protein